MYSTGHSFNFRRVTAVETAILRGLTVTMEQLAPDLLSSQNHSGLGYRHYWPFH
jgi:hypothetical protein